MGQKIDEWIRFFNIKTEGEVDDNMHMKRVMDKDNRGVERGIEQGIEQGIGRIRQRRKKENLIKLISSMNAGGDTDKVAQLDDPEVLLAMQRKYGMINSDIYKTIRLQNGTHQQLHNAERQITGETYVKRLSGYFEFVYREEKMRADKIKTIIGNINDLPYKTILFDGTWGV